MRYLFDDFALDTSRRELRRGADVVPTTPQVFDLLDYLIQHRDHVVSKGDIISAVWNGRVVSDAALTTRLNAARAAVGDDGDKQRLIKTFPRKGFRFVGAVHEGLGPETALARSAAQNNGTIQRPPSPPRISIVVLPFANLSGGPEQDYFVDGVTESLTSDLSRISGSFVIARATAFSYKGKSIDVRQVGRELNIRYVLQGSVQRSANRLRVNVQLVNAENAGLMWVDRFDKPIADLFDMQDEIVSRLANALNTQLIEAEARRAERSPNPNSLDLYFQGMASLYKGSTPDHLAQARNFFERALVLDPGSVEVLVGLAHVAGLVCVNFSIDDCFEQFAVQEAASIRALSISPHNAWAHLELGCAQIGTNRAAQGISECERALELNRNLPEAHASIGGAKMLIGRAAEVEGHVQGALRLSPRDASLFRWLHWVGIAKLLQGADAEAASWLRRSLEANRNNPLAHFHLGAALVFLHRADEARGSVRAGLALDPTFTIRRMRRVSDDPTFRAQSKRVREGMRLAGLPEE